MFHDAVGSIVGLREISSNSVWWVSLINHGGLHEGQRSLLFISDPHLYLNRMENVNYTFHEWISFCYF